MATPDAASRCRGALKDAQDRLQRCDPLEEEGEEQELQRLRAAAALDELQRLRAPIRQDEVDVFALRPPWTSNRPRAASARASGGSIAESRAKLAALRPKAAALLAWMDERARAHEPYRRLSSARHLPWASASVAASVAAVQASRTESKPHPHVLVAEGGLGAEAAAAAAAGALVTVCEGNRFAAAAIEAVAAQHGVQHRVTVVHRSLEAHVALAGCDADVVLLTPLIDEAALGRRLLPSAAAVAAAASAAASAQPPLLVPQRASVYGALALVTAGQVHGVQLGALDAARWTPYPLPWAAEAEEGAQLLTAFGRLFDFDLSASSGEDVSSNAEADASVQFAIGSAAAASANAATGGQGGADWAWCNAIVLHTAPTFGDEGARCLPGEGAAHEHRAQKRAVLFFEPRRLRASSRVVVRVHRNAHRIWVDPPPPPGPATPVQWWGRLLLQHWHFAMLRDAPRNDAYAAALRRAAAAMTPPARPAGGGEGRPHLSVDVGTGSGLLALLLAKAMPSEEAGHVVGVEILASVGQVSVPVSRTCLGPGAP